MIENEKSKKPSKLVRTSGEKIFLLAQERVAEMGDQQLPQSLKQESEMVVKEAQRIFGAVFEYAASESHLNTALAAFKLTRTMKMKQWENTENEPRQLSGIGPKACEKLEQAGIKKLDQLASCDPRSLERITGRAYPTGNSILHQVSHIPKASVILSMSDEVMGVGSKGKTITILVTKERECNNQAEKTRAALISGNLSSDELKVNETLVLEKCPTRYTTQFEWTPGEGDAFAALLFSEVIGRDTEYTLDMSRCEHRNKARATSTHSKKRARSEESEKDAQLKQSESSTGNREDQHFLMDTKQPDARYGDEPTHHANNAIQLRQSRMTDSFPSTKSGSSTSSADNNAAVPRTREPTDDDEVMLQAAESMQRQHDEQSSARALQEDSGSGASAKQQRADRRSDSWHQDDQQSQENYCSERAAPKVLDRHAAPVSWSDDSPYIANDGFGTGKLDTSRILDDLLL